MYYVIAACAGVDNCETCESESTCATCSTGFTASEDKTTCDAISKSIVEHRNTYNVGDKLSIIVLVYTDYKKYHNFN